MHVHLLSTKTQNNVNRASSRTMIAHFDHLRCDTYEGNTPTRRT